MYKTKEFLPLHEPRFIGNEIIDSTYVSSLRLLNKLDMFKDAQTGNVDNTE